AAPPPASLRYRLFLGFSAAANQIEAISWNNHRGRFEFQILSNYGPQAKLLNPPRQDCTLCHQGEGPIFPRFPCGETDQTNAAGRDNPATRVRIIRALGGKDRFQGVDLAGPTTIFRIDESIRGAYRLLQARGACARLCEGGLSAEERNQCRGDLL